MSLFVSPPQIQSSRKSKLSSLRWAYVLAAMEKATMTLCRSPQGRVSSQVATTLKMALILLDIIISRSSKLCVLFLYFIFSTTVGVSMVHG